MLLLVCIAKGRRYIIIFIHEIVDELQAKIHSFLGQGSFPKVGTSQDLLFS